MTNTAKPKILIPPSLLILHTNQALLRNYWGKVMLSDCKSLKDDWLASPRRSAIYASKDCISTALIFPASLALTRELFLAEFPTSEDGKIAFILLFNRSLIWRWTIGQISVLNHPKLSDSKVSTIHLIYHPCLISFLPGYFAHNGRKKSGIPKTENYFKISLF